MTEAERTAELRDRFLHLQSSAFRHSSYTNMRSSPLKDMSGGQNKSFTNAVFESTGLSHNRSVDAPPEVPDDEDLGLELDILPSVGAPRRPKSMTNKPHGRTGRRYYSTGGTIPSNQIATGSIAPQIHTGMDFSDPSSTIGSKLGINVKDGIDAKPNLDSLSNITGSTGDVGLEYQRKIQQLAKRGREVQAAYEAERGRNGQLRQRLRQAETELAWQQSKSGVAQTQHHQQRLRSASSGSGGGASPLKTGIQSETGGNEGVVLPNLSQMKLLKAQLQDMHKRLESSQAETKRYKTLLFREVGEDAAQGLSSSGGTNLEKIRQSSWRGRAERIKVLQVKVARLEKELAVARNPSTTDIAGNANSGASIGNANYNERSGIAKAQKTKQAQLDALKHETDALKQELEDSRAKYVGASAKLKVTREENKRLKQHMQMLMDKANHDDDLVLAFKQENVEQQRRIKKLRNQLEALGQLPQEMTGLSTDERPSLVKGDKRTAVNGLDRPHHRNKDRSNIVALEAELTAAHGRLKRYEAIIHELERRNRAAGGKSNKSNASIEGVSDGSINSTGSSLVDLLKTEYVSVNEEAMRKRCIKLENDIIPAMQKDLQRLWVRLTASEQRNREVTWTLKSLDAAMPGGGATDVEKMYNLKELSREDLIIHFELQSNEIKTLKHTLKSMVDAKERDIGMYNDLLVEVKQLYLNSVRKLLNRVQEMQDQTDEQQMDQHHRDPNSKELQAPTNLQQEQRSEIIPKLSMQAVETGDEPSVPQLEAPNENGGSGSSSANDTGIEPIALPLQSPRKPSGEPTAQNQIRSKSWSKGRQLTPRRVTERTVTVALAGTSLPQPTVIE
eukprot:Clim_evm20s25 gene=Clim_evmTU20s25